MSAAPDDWPPVEFLLQLREDQAAGVERPLAWYLAQHPGHELTIAREYLLACGDSPAMPRTSIAGFELLEELGRGGEGVVYRARDVVLGREVALKIMAHNAGDLEAARMVRAAAMAARLEHPAIVRVHGAGRHERQLWVAAAYVPGHSLAVELERRRGLGRTFAARELARILAPIADALQHAHERGVVHRDVKPGNLLVRADGTLVLADFGMARDGDADHDLTVSGELRGTPAYMAPEQVRDGARGPAVDVFALGVVACECALMASPFRGVTAAATLDHVVATEVWSLPGWRHLHPDLQAVLALATAKDPQRRYASAAAMAADLERLARGEPVLARAPSTARRLAIWARRHRALATSLVGTAAVLACSCIVLAGFFWRERDLRQQAQDSAGRTRAVARAILFERTRSAGNADSVARRAHLVQEALRALERMADEAPTDQQLQRELCLAWIRLGELHGSDSEANLGDPDRARHCFEQAERRARSHLIGEPRQPALLATARLRLASLQRSEPEVAAQGYRAAFELATTADRESRAVRGAAAALLAQSARDAGDLAAAREWIETAQREFRGDPDDPDSRQNLIAASLPYASILAMGGEPEAAERLLRTTMQQLEAERPPGPQRGRLLPDFERALANCLMLQGRNDEALASFDAAVQSARLLSAADQTDQGAARRLADMLDSRAGALAAVGRPEPSAADRAEAAAVAARFGFAAARDRAASERLLGR